MCVCGQYTVQYTVCASVWVTHIHLLLCSHHSLLNSSLWPYTQLKASAKWAKCSFMCVCLLVSSFYGNIHLFIQSHCVNSPSFWDPKASHHFGFWVKVGFLQVGLCLGLKWTSKKGMLVNKNLLWSDGNLCVCVRVCVVLRFQRVWSMEGQQPGSRETRQFWWQRWFGSAPRPWLHADHPPAGEAANPPDDYRKCNQEIRHPHPPFCHSGRYSRAHWDSWQEWFTQFLI